MTVPDTRPSRALAHVATDGTRVLLLGLDELGDDCWAVLAAAGIEVARVADVPDAIRALREPVPQLVIADAAQGGALTAAVRQDPALASAHVVLCAALDAPDELRAALDAGADDVMRVPFEPEVLIARVVAGLRAARLRENEALLRSLIDNIPGAVYRCACDADWTMQYLSD
ncbi:MAG TPA: hypothetical protein VFG79_22900, partial [Solirubrobacter sp.]|nr:hypothetical protein [Solirubrobacter sp.]